MIESEDRSPLDTLDPLESLITPHALREYLAAQQWTLLKERPSVAQLWGNRLNEKRPIFIPLDASYVDYGRRLKEAISDAAQAFNLSVRALVDEVSKVRTDLFLVRLDQETLDGTIPFDQAKTALESIERMVRSAATVVENPHHSGRGRRPRKVTEFMKEDLRFGQTREGSFILTVAARVGGASVSRLQADEVDLPEEGRSFSPALDEEPKTTDAQDAPGTSVPTAQQTSDAEDFVTPFPRRVMEALALSVEATRKYVSDDADALDLEQAVLQGARLDVVQAIIDLTEAEGVQSLDMSFQWAAALPSGVHVPERAVISKSDLPEVVAMRDRLVRREEPREEVLMGRVKALSRDEVGGGDEESIVILEAKIDGRIRNVRVALAPTEYEWAIRAHQRRLPFTVSGTLVKRRSWELEGDVKVDISFLKHTLDSRGTDVK